ncbi:MULTISPECIES: hypothetical protein [unclassified Agarivorans]|uniref:hypothetical protein n=1 Tax=unclassified Agarivorans TaxID=2636026 RepID=UPI0026E322CD|nr:MULTISPECIES: hypothetical protein [unclassified Agarivorans]MDO6686671.1 hypothetical protein [Agarivorans sp. 3_MG-2023]MDO6716599.1 hypothetical protein [Agarivorans sp. 2_MG-2023]
MLTTIIAGVTVFVIGQFILKLVLEPVVSYRESLGSISAFFLQNRAAITNFNATKDMQEELRVLIATVLAKKEAVPAYSVVSQLLFLISDRDLINGCQVLNLVAYEMNSQTAMKRELEGSISLERELKKAGSLLKIRVDFSD